MPDSEEGKLLGVQVITSSTGEKQAETSFALAEQHHDRSLARTHFNTAASLKYSN